MKIIIDIPKEMYERIKDGYVPLGISKYLKNSTPLLKELSEAYLKGYDYGVKDWFKSKTESEE